MEIPFGQTNEGDHFAHAFGKNVECILPTTEMFINFKANGIKTKKHCYVYAEKIDFKGLIQIRLTEKCDHRRMYVTTVDSASFVELKQDQSLHVTFAGFVDNLIRLIQDCQSGKLELHIVQQTNKDTSFGNNTVGAINGAGDGVVYQMQFLEVRTFKNLIHLCLPCRLAPLNVVLFYMNGIIDAMQKKLVNHENSNQQLQQELVLQQRRNEQFENENQKLRENFQEQLQNMNQKHMEDTQKLQESIRKTTELHHSDNERSRKTINALQTQIEKLNQERITLQAEKSEEIKRNESLQSELANINTKFTQVKTKEEQLQLEIASLKNEERKTEMHLNDARKHINELQERLKKIEKNKADVVAELEAEKKISQTKRQALEVATEEISKANEIIYNQAQELLKLKKTIAWRTEIALEQEKAIKEKERELSIYEEELKQTKIIVKSLRDEVPCQLDSLRQFANSLETKYKEEINALRQSLNAEKESPSLYSSKATSSRRS